MSITSISQTCVQAYQTANDSAKIEDDPKPRDVSTFLLLWRIRHHDRSLRGPKDTCTTSEEQAREDNVAEVSGMVKA
jgi:hypothetical protein